MQDVHHGSDFRSTDNFDLNYIVDPDAVADALLHRIDQLAEERARYRRALISSAEMVMPADLDGPAIAA